MTRGPMAAMATRELIVDVEADAGMLVNVYLAGESSGDSLAGYREVIWPIRSDALDQLRWYLEDYLSSPFGVYGDQGRAVAAGLRGWGEAIFAAVFGSGTGSDVYRRVRADAGVGIQIVVRSSSSAVLALPWELMHDPSRPVPLAVELAGVSRSVPSGFRDDATAMGSDTLRVLMVISRPRGRRDVGYRMIGRLLVERLEGLRGRVELVVLRPPSMVALSAALTGAVDQGQPFHVVHFDGHGDLSEHEGTLIFERSGGGSEKVPARQLAPVLRAGRVPLVVLNACQSGAVGKELEAAIATRLLQEGTESVVAMAYRVHPVAAAEFIGPFYERLFAGDTVTEAVTAGRRRLYEHSERPSPKGMIPLADWVIPVHYRGREVRFFGRRGSTTRQQGAEPVDAVVDHRLEQVGSFVGRDDLFYELEVATREHKAVLLHGLGGTGKTELAKAFGRWWLKTGGVVSSAAVIVQSFRPGTATVDLDQTLMEIGLQVLGADIAHLDSTERRVRVENVLAEQRMLLIWDNFEAVLSMPDLSSGGPRLDDNRAQEFREFLHRSSKGASSVIVTSRSDERWLGDLYRIEVGGLAADEAIEYADQILAAVPAATSRRAKPAFAELLNWLGGHPLSMRVVLPHLASTDPDALLAALRSADGRTTGATGSDDGTMSLEASIAYSFDHLTARTRGYLKSLCLLDTVVDMRMLAMLSGKGSTAPQGDWTTVVSELASYGLLAKIDAQTYRIHPALPAYVNARWRNERPDGYDGERGVATWLLLTAHARMGQWLTQQTRGDGDARAAFAILDDQWRTFGQFLESALQKGWWSEAAAILQPLLDYLNSRGLDEEARVWEERVRAAVEAADGTPPPLDGQAGLLWRLCMDRRAYRHVRRRQHDSARTIYLDIVRRLEALPHSDERQESLVEAYLGLKHVAHVQGRLDDGQRWLDKAVSLAEDARDPQAIMHSDLERGMLAQERGNFDEAEDWFQRVLNAAQDVGDRPALAAAYHQLGRLAWQRGRLDQAHKWSVKSLGVNLSLGDQQAVAGDYYQVAMVEQSRGRLEEAEKNHIEALRIREKLGDRAAVARSYHEIGMVVQERGRLDDAGAWYARSLAIKKDLGDRRGMALTYGQIGLLAEARGNDPAALEWTVRCVALFDEFPSPATAVGPRELVRLTAKLGIEALEACWQWVTGESLPVSVRRFIKPDESRDPSFG